MKKCNKVLIIWHEHTNRRNSFRYLQKKKAILIIFRPEDKALFATLTLYWCLLYMIYQLTERELLNMEQKKYYRLGTIMISYQWPYRGEKIFQLLRLNHGNTTIIFYAFLMWRQYHKLSLNHGTFQYSTFQINTSSNVHTICSQFLILGQAIFNCYLLKNIAFLYSKLQNLNSQ